MFQKVIDDEKIVLISEINLIFVITITILIFSIFFVNFNKIEFNFIFENEK